MKKPVEWTIPPIFDKKFSTDAEYVEYWNNSRKAELIDLLGKTVYGITPKRLPDKIVPEIIEDNPYAHDCKNHHIKVLLHLHYDDKSVALEVWLYFPYGEGPFPVQVMIDPFERYLHGKALPEYLYSFFPADMITDRGYVAVKILASTACPDDRNSYRDGLLSILDGSEEGIAEEHRWGCIGAWAYLASRTYDYLSTLEKIDASRIAISGCSRAGKTALWCGAQDTRFAVVMSNVSGTSGAALTRGKIGEHLCDIVKNYPFWFCPNYATYAQRTNELPIDQHMLLALSAPRPFYLASASEDIWADTYAEYRALQLAMEVYHKHGYQVALPATRPPANHPLHVKQVGYHLRQGIHDLFPYDWERYMDFCDSYIN